MRIETSGDYALRTDLFDATGALGESTRSAGLDGTAELVPELLGGSGFGPGALQNVATLLEDDRVPDEIALEIAEDLSVRPVDISIKIRSARISLRE